MALVIVKADGTEDYTLLSSAISSSETEIEIQGTWASAETVINSISSATTIEATGDSKHPGYTGGSPTHWRHRPTSGHAFTASANLTLTGMDICSASTGTSDEVIRCGAASITITIDSCLCGFVTPSDQQDFIYSNANNNIDVVITNSIVINVYRSVVGFFRSAGTTYNGTVDLNSSHFYNIGVATPNGTTGKRTGLVGVSYYSVTVSNFNCAYHSNNTAGTYGYVYAEDSSGGTITATTDRFITNKAQVDNSTNTDVLLSRTWAASDSGTGDYVIVQNITSGSEDLRLRDLGNSKNNAQDAHADGSGASLTMPSTDIVGTSRPQDTNYDIGAFEIVVDTDEEITESITLSDSQSEITSYIAAISETATLSDTSNGLVSGISDSTETISLTDDTNGLITFQSSLTESASLTDATDGTVSTQGEITESISLSDSQDAILSALSAVEETTILTDSNDSIVSYNVAITESITLSDATDGTVETGSVIEEAVILSDNQESTASYIGTLSEAISLDDTQNGLTAYISVNTDGMVLSDEQDATVSSKEIEETISLTDLTDGLLTVNASTVETTTLTDSSDCIGTYLASITEAISLTDVISYPSDLVADGEIITVDSIITEEITSSSIITEVITVDSIISEVITVDSLIQG